MGSFFKLETLILIYAIYIISVFLYCVFGVFVFKNLFQFLIHKHILLHVSSNRFVFMPSTFGFYSICNSFLYRIYSRDTTLFFSIQWENSPNTIPETIYHFLIVLRCHSYYISNLLEHSSGLYILFHFFFSVHCCDRNTLKKCYGSNAHEGIGRKNQQPLLHYFSGTHCTLFKKITVMP